MEKKDYEKKFLDIKNEILEEIRELLPRDSAHRFKEKFYIHYVDGEIATTDVCAAIEVWFGGEIAVVVSNGKTEKDEVVEGDSVYKYEPQSFIDILDNLKKELRAEKLKTLIEIVAGNDGEILFDGKKDLFLQHDTAIDRCKIESLRIDEGGKLSLEYTFAGNVYYLGEDELLLAEIIDCIAFSREKFMKKFVIRVSGSFSRTFDIDALNYEDALELAKKDWELHPLCSDDSNGEDWEDYTLRTH